MYDTFPLFLGAFFFFSLRLPQKMMLLVLACGAPRENASSTPRRGARVMDTHGTAHLLLSRHIHLHALTRLT